MKDIRQRDLDASSFFAGGFNSDKIIQSDPDIIKENGRIVPPPSVVMQKRNSTTRYSIFNPWVFMILFLLGLACTLVGTYRSGYKQAKIDYHIKP